MRKRVYLWIYLFVVAPIGAVVIVCAMLLFGVKPRSVFAVGWAVKSALHAPNGVGVVSTVLFWWLILALLGLAWEWWRSKR
jgi:hypothetical protein